jgi:hypothetical protein
MMDILALRVARRFRAELLTKQWLEGVRRGWRSLVRRKAPGKLIEFLDHLEDQVTYVRRMPATIDEDLRAEGLKIQLAFDAVKSSLKREDLGSAAANFDKLLDLLLKQAVRLQKAPKVEKQEFEEPTFKEFDLHGIKVIIDDDTVSPEDIQKYIALFHEAYTGLRAKRSSSSARAAGARTRARAGALGPTTTSAPTW